MSRSADKDMRQSAPALDFSRRNALTELMDAESDEATFRACLVDLAQVNWLTLAYWPTLRFFGRLER